MSSHVYSKLCYHLVWTTYKQQPLIPNQVLWQLHCYVAGVIKALKGIPLEVGGTHNHIHVLVQVAPGVTISRTVNGIKVNATRFMKNQGIFDFAWQRGYGVFTVDASSMKRLKNYISNQETHHQSMRYEKELALLLRRYQLTP